MPAHWAHPAPRVAGKARVNGARPLGNPLQVNAMPRTSKQASRTHKSTTATRRPARRTSMTAATSLRSPAFQLSSAMHRLWTDHVLWTHTYVVAATSGPHGLTDVAEHLPVGRMGSGVATAAQKALGAMPLSDADATAARLLRNQEDIGNAVAQFYGKDAGKELTKLLKEHIMIAVELVAAAKAEDTKAFARHDKRWLQNVDEIADFLADANPHLPAKDVKDLLHLHLELTKQETEAYLKHEWKRAIGLVDDIVTEILNLADAITAAIVKQFPERFES